jgi:hypothetical protein
MDQRWARITSKSDLSGTTKCDQNCFSDLCKFGHTLAGHKHELLVNELVSEGGLMKKKLELSSSFRCYIFHDCPSYDFGHTLLCNLSQTYKLNKPTSVYAYKSKVGLLSI